MAFIEVKDLSYSYNTSEDEESERGALNSLSFSVEKGEFVAVLGHNGSGKSTLAKLLSMVLEAKSGEITIGGVRIHSEMTDDEVIEVRKKVGMIFQNPDDQIVATIVEDDVAFGPENLGVEQSEIRRRVYSALDAVSMREYARHAPHKLSGGQKQRVAIAGVLAMMPECIIFDEATAMLDPIGRKDVMGLVKKIHSENITVLFITHNMDEAAEADRIIVLDKGEFFLEGTPSEIFAKPEALYSVGLEVPIPTEIAGMLKNEGILDKSDLLTEEECAEEILKALGVK